MKDMIYGGLRFFRIKRETDGDLEVYDAFVPKYRYGRIMLERGTDRMPWTAELFDGRERLTFIAGSSHEVGLKISEWTEVGGCCE